VVAVVGVTAGGKTALGEDLAERLGGAVLCADSRQVYRELAIGTGKPSPEDLAARPHLLFDALALGEPASAGWYARAVRVAASTARGAGRVPVLVGGSGLYLRAAMSGLAATPEVDPAVRARIAGEWEALGAAALHGRLRRGDPETAARLAVRDRQRVSRALEVLESTGRPLSWWHRQPRGPAVEGQWRVVELVVAPRVLAARIEERTRWMFDHGLPEETAGLLGRGLERALRRLRAVGYDEAMDLLQGRIDRATAEARTGLRTRQLAKRQRTWFRHQVDAVRLDADAADPGRLLAAVLREVER
jgi:tRNA dimethylallyltransferase